MMMLFLRSHLYLFVPPSALSYFLLHPFAEAMQACFALVTYMLLASTHLPFSFASPLGAAFTPHFGHRLPRLHHCVSCTHTGSDTEYSTHGPKK